MSESLPQPSSHLWPTTDWAGLRLAGGGGPGDPDHLGRLLALYHRPLMVFLTASFPGLRQEAEQILLEFAEDRLLKEGWLQQADRGKGRFRSFLKTSLRNYVQDHLRSRAKQPISLEVMDIDPAMEEEAESQFDLAWARIIVDETLRRMEADCLNATPENSGRTRIWQVFSHRLLRPAFEGGEPTPYDELIAATGIVSPVEAQNLLASAKRIFARHLHRVIADYERDRKATREELSDLRAFLDRAARGELQPPRKIR
jgi:RNA polymerase sigma-70 factor (ECF subfamily)